MGWHTKESQDGNFRHYEVTGSLTVEDGHRNVLFSVGGAAATLTFRDPEHYITGWCCRVVVAETGSAVTLSGTTFSGWVRDNNVTNGKVTVLPATAGTFSTINMTTTCEIGDSVDIYAIGGKLVVRGESRATNGITVS